jgi:hypothetical protein
VYQAMEWFCEQVGYILGASNVVDINEPVVDRVTDEVGTYVNMLHSGMGLQIVCAGDSALVVTVKWRGICLWEPELFEQGA